MNKSRQQGCFPAPCRFFTLFSLFGTFVPHITQKAKPAFPPALARPCCQGPRFFYHGSFKALSFGEGWARLLSLSVEQLRMKSGKTIVALCMAGHRKFLQRIGPCAHCGRKKIPAQVLPDLQGKPCAAKKPFD
ncbi:hypothetical protein [Mucilaginibacter mallensis]|uniref:hypothetical protein n=1 Tax=Mucilaginibacter mallensis TaxID=652787 RepID=UPI0012FC7131|nr:hypothetical protein [Mucilaginibacter mallensis]